MLTSQPPKHLSTRSRRFWRDVLRDFDLEPSGLAILRVACEAMDRMDEARSLVTAEGLTVEGRLGPRAHPALSIERDARLAMLRALRALGLDKESQR